MTDIAKDLRAELAERLHARRGPRSSPSRSRSTARANGCCGCRRRARRRGAEIETRLHPRGRPRHAVRLEPGRLHAHLLASATPARSGWCATSTPREIVGQIMLARDRLGDWPGARRRPTTACARRGAHDHQRRADGHGRAALQFRQCARRAWRSSPTATASRCRKRRITLSTSGVVPKIARWPATRSAPCSRSRCTRCATSCATSSCRSTANIRSHELLDACRAYPGALQRAAHHLRICDAEGRQRQRSPTPASWCGCSTGIPAKINLIPFNPWPGAPYECSDWEQIESFAEIVFRAGYASPVRTPRGRDILAACGQLKSETEKLRARARLIADEA